jgi:hypothetical protein
MARPPALEKGPVAPQPGLPDEPPSRLVGEADCPRGKAGSLEKTPSLWGTSKVGSQDVLCFVLADSSTSGSRWKKLA